MAKPPTTIESRFWKFVQKTDGGCWIWTGSTNLGGYGQIFSGKGRPATASRASWEIANGPIPDGLWVLHKCDNPPCVNPDHLFLGTIKDNARDMIKKGRGVSFEFHSQKSRGEGNGMAKLKEADVLVIRRLASEGATYKELGQRYGVLPETIGLIVRKITWKHV